MPRIPELTPEEMNPEQKAVFDDIMSGPRGSLRGPFHAWLHSPQLADRAQKLGAFCRFSSTLPKRLSELAIIVIARHWCAQFEWYAHAPEAIEAGISADAVEAIRNKGEPELTEPDEILIYGFVHELLETRTVSRLGKEGSKLKFAGEQTVNIAHETAVSYTHLPLPTSDLV